MSNSELLGWLVLEGEKLEDQRQGERRRVVGGFVGVRVRGEGHCGIAVALWCVI